MRFFTVNRDALKSNLRIGQGGIKMHHANRTSFVVAPDQTGGFYHGMRMMIG